MANLNVSNLKDSLNRPISQLRRLPLGYIGGIFGLGLGLFAITRIFPGGIVSRGFYQIRNLLPFGGELSEGDQSQAA